MLITFAKVLNFGKGCGFEPALFFKSMARCKYDSPYFLKQVSCKYDLPIKKKNR